MLNTLELLQRDSVPCLANAEAGGQTCTEAGWTSRPSWHALFHGARPPEPEPAELALGEWAHGWQYYASNALETAEFDALLSALAYPNTCRNAASVAKVRLHSCRGRFAPAWLTSMPCSTEQAFSDAELTCAMRRRLGLAVVFEGPDPHGHRRLAETLAQGSMPAILFLSQRGGRCLLKQEAKCPIECRKDVAQYAHPCSKR